MKSESIFTLSERRRERERESGRVGNPTLKVRQRDRETERQRDRNFGRVGDKNKKEKNRER